MGPAPETRASNWPSLAALQSFPIRPVVAQTLQVAHIIAVMQLVRPVRKKKREKK